MSLLPILWALKSAPLADATEKLIIVAQAEHAFSDGCDAFPSKKTLAEISMTDPKTVQRKLRALEDRKVIARGNQAAAAYIDEWFRPTVYDLLIPYSWFPDIEQINAERKARGKGPLTPENRPDIEPAPPRKRRSDKGKHRPKRDGQGGGDSESPGSSSDGAGDASEGGTESPGGGDSQSRRGGLEDPQPSPLDPPPMNLPGDAPSARSANDARRASTGSRGSAAGGFAASSKGRKRLTKAEYEAIRTVRDLLPDDLGRRLPVKTPTNLGAAILDALAVGEPFERTPKQLVEYRVMPRWDRYWASKFYSGELGSMIGPLIAMLRHQQECGDISCEDRVNIHTGEPCGACEVRQEDRKRKAEQGRPREATPTSEGHASVPSRHPTEAGRPKCPRCRIPLATATEPELCRDCKAEAAYA